MTNFTKSIMVAAAALVVAGAASAQSMRADIPFAFHVGNKLMQPGVYEISAFTKNVPTYRFMNINLRESAVTPTNLAHDPAKDWKADSKPRIVFACGASGCSISDLWDGQPGSFAHEFPGAKSRHEATRMAVIVAEPIRGE